MSQTIYAIGDVHGRADLLEEAIEFVAGQDDGGAVRFLGDIVDRGPDAKGALDIVVETLERLPGSVLHLGNHDKWFYDAVMETDPRKVNESWLLNGGIATLESYHPDLMLAIDAVREDRPAHLRAIAAAPMIANALGLTFVHAGIKPGKPITQQDPADLLWIRDQFLDFAGSLGSPIVHGHEIVGRLPVVTENRISLDTGAYETNRLSILRVDGENGELTFFQATPGGVDSVEPKRLDRGYGTIERAVFERKRKRPPGLSSSSFPRPSGLGRCAMRR